MSKLINCFSYVHGHKEAQEVVTDLNQMKSEKSKDFYIKYDSRTDYSKKDSYLIMGKVTQQDWDELNLESDFMEL